MKLVHIMIGTFSYMRYSYHGDFMIPTLRSSVPHSETMKMITGIENAKEDTWVTEAQKNRFPKSPEPLEDILNCNPKIQKVGLKIDEFLEFRGSWPSYGTSSA